MGGWGFPKWRLRTGTIIQKIPLVGVATQPSASTIGGSCGVCGDFIYQDFMTSKVNLRTFDAKHESYSSSICRCCGVLGSVF